jgi:hypothetical protein
MFEDWKKLFTSFNTPSECMAGQCTALKDPSLDAVNWLVNLETCVRVEVETTNLTSQATIPVDATQLLWLYQPSCQNTKLYTYPIKMRSVNILGVHTTCSLNRYCTCICIPTVTPHHMNMFTCYAVAHKTYMPTHYVYMYCIFTPGRWFVYSYATSF